MKVFAKSVHQKDLDALILMVQQQLQLVLLVSFEYTNSLIKIIHPMVKIGVYQSVAHVLLAINVRQIAQLRFLVILVIILQLLVQQLAPNALLEKPVLIEMQPLILVPLVIHHLQDQLRVHLYQ